MAGTMFASPLRNSLLLLCALAALGAGLFVWNATPTAAPVPAAEVANPSKPFVIKLHAQWCPICMLTKDEWAGIEQTYAGRVNLVVFDSTTESDRERSREEAARLGLSDALEGFYGATGVVLVVDPRTREIVAEIAGVHSIEDYRRAIDSSLAALPGTGQTTP